MVTLEVYVSDGCWSCVESRRLVAELAPQYPSVTMELLDVVASGQPEIVFAVPTYLLNGKVVFLGNPHPEELRRKLNAALALESGR